MKPCIVCDGSRTLKPDFRACPACLWAWLTPHIDATRVQYPKTAIPTMTQTAEVIQFDVYKQARAR